MKNIQKKLIHLIEKTGNDELIKTWNDFIRELNEMHLKINEEQKKYLNMQLEFNQELAEINLLLEARFPKK